MKRFVLLALIIPFNLTSKAQIHPSELGGADLNHLRSSVPFLNIAPDARASGMGDAGAASEPDVHSQHWNLAKFAFTEGKGGLACTYTAWLRNLVPDISLIYLSSYHKINNKNILSSSFRYFDLGDLYFAMVGVPTNFKPKEYALDLGYTRLITDHFSAGLSFRYIQSHLLDASHGGNYIDGISYAGDIAIYYKNLFVIGERTAQWAFGLALTNLGPALSYSKDDDGLPLPTNLRIGGRFHFPFNSLHSLSVQADVNKLLVPTPPVYERDTATGDYFIARGKAAPKSVFKGMIQSFYDAPGIQQNNGSYSVLQEEMFEIMYAIGLEYKYNNMLALRTGYFNEHATKGNRKYFTFGIGGTYQMVSIDLSYLIPTKGQNSPLANTLRVMLTIEFG